MKTESTTLSPDRRENPCYWEIAAQARNDKIGMIAGQGVIMETDVCASHKKKSSL